jgi:hypothetical protein
MPSYFALTDQDIKNKIQDPCDALLHPTKKYFR